MSGDAASSRLILIGAHLKLGDVTPVEQAVPLTAGSLTLSSVTLPEGRSPAEPEIIQRVARVRQELVEQEIFLAIRYGVTVHDEGEAEEKCRERLGEWEERLRRHRGRVEITLRIGAPGTSVRPDRKDFNRGTDYLRELHRLRAERSIPEEFRSAVDERFAAVTLERRWIRRESGFEEMAGLIRRSSLETVREIGAELKRRFPHVAFMISGPWPLEAFADDPE